MKIKINSQVKFLKSGISGIALDIDETLSVTSPILFKFLNQKFGNPENLTDKEVQQKYLFTQNVPYWQTEEALQFIESLRNNHDMHLKFALTDGVYESVKEISKLVPIVAYLTVRPQLVLTATAKWLKKHNLPEATIIARPDNIPYEQGNIWKAAMLEKLYPQIIGIVDDNPGLVDALSETYPGVVFMYGRVDHPKKRINIIPSKTWQDVVHHSRTYFSQQVYSKTV